MTGRALSARCTDLGLEIRPAVLSTIETGVRDSITTAEMLVLSAALGVPLAALLLPVGKSPDVEVLPDVTVSVDKALAWIDGDPVRFPGTTGPLGSALVAVTNTRRHSRMVMYAASARERLTESPDDQARQREWEMVKDNLRGLRATMRAYGETPPALPGDLADLDDTPEPIPDVVITDIGNGAWGEAGFRIGPADPPSGGDA